MVFCWRDDSKVYDCFDLYGVFICRNAKLVVFASVTLSLAIAVGMLNFETVTDIQSLYTPVDAPSRREQRVKYEYYNPTPAPPPSTIAVGHTMRSGAKTSPLRASPNAPVKPPPPPPARPNLFQALVFEANGEKVNLLSEETMERILKFEKFIRNHFNYTFEGKKYNFGQSVCYKSECYGTLTLVKRFKTMFHNKELKDPDEKVSFSYPVVRIAGIEYYVGDLLHGVTLDPKSMEMSSAKVLQAGYSIQQAGNFTAEAHVQAFGKALLRYLQQRNRDRKLEFFVHTISNDVLNREMNGIVPLVIPNLIATILVIGLFAVLSNVNVDDWVATKFWEAFFGLVSSFLALPPTVGLLSLVGVPFNSTVAIMPFLVLAIGVDDMFLLLAAWGNTSREKAVERRLAETMREVGAAICLTSLTDVVSFGIGTLSQTPAMSVFCLYLAVGITFDFILQITFFPAILALGGQREKRRRHGIICCITAKKKSDSTALSRLTGTIRKEGGKILVLLRQPFSRICVTLLYCVYLCVALYGCSHLTINLQTSKLLADDSPVVPYFELLEKYIWQEGMKAEVTVMKAPDFRNDSESAKFMSEFVAKFESTEFSSGTAATSLWLRNFLDHRTFIKIKNKDFYKRLFRFLKLNAHTSMAKHIRWKSDSSVVGGRIVESFHFIVYFGKVGTWRNRVKLQKTLRDIVSRFPEYKAVVNLDFSYFTDQVATLGRSTMQTMGIALLCMAAIAIIFFPNVEAAFWVFLSLLSINAGVVGLLVLWGAELDPMTMVDIVMSIGFSVDFAAHFCFQYYRIRKHLTSQGFNSDVSTDVLKAVGWPLLQCALSTLLAVISLGLVRANIVRVLFRTVVLVVSLGLLHALVILPAVLPCTDLTDRPRKKIYLRQRKPL